MAISPQTASASTGIGIKGLETSADMLVNSIEATGYYENYNPKAEMEKSLGRLQPNSYGEIDLSSVYAFKPIDYYGSTGSGKNGRATVGERLNTSVGGDGFQVADVLTAPLIFSNTYTGKIYNKANKELDAYKKQLTRNAMGYNQGVATRRAYYDKLLEDQSFDYSKFYGNA